MRRVALVDNHEFGWHLIAPQHEIDGIQRQMRPVLGGNDHGDASKFKLLFRACWRGFVLNM